MDIIQINTIETLPVTIWWLVAASRHEGKIVQPPIHFDINQYNEIVF